MLQKYVYTYNGVWNFIRGIVPFSSGSKMVFPYRNPDQTFVWRNQYTEGYKIGLSYTDEPLDLTNYLFIRTRERFLLSNKVKAPHLVLQSGKPSRLTGPTSVSALDEVEVDLNRHLKLLERMLNVLPSNV